MTLNTEDNNNGYHLLSIYYVPSPLYALSDLIFITAYEVVLLSYSF